MRIVTLSSLDHSGWRERSAFFHVSFLDACHVFWFLQLHLPQPSITPVGSFNFGLLRFDPLATHCALRRPHVSIYGLLRLSQMRTHRPCARPESLRWAISASVACRSCVLRRSPASSTLNAAVNHVSSLATAFLSLSLSLISHPIT